MQEIFAVSVSPSEYARQEKKFPFPSPRSCLNPRCRYPLPPRKHGYYERYCIDHAFAGRILIRRYRCPVCGMTFSYLPAFCLPFFQYSLPLIGEVLERFYHRKLSLETILRLLGEASPHLYWGKSHLFFFLRRFRENFSLLCLGLRALYPRLPLPDPAQEGRERSGRFWKILGGKWNLPDFSLAFFRTLRTHFLAPAHAP